MMDFHKPGPNKRVCAFLTDYLIGLIAGEIIFSISGSAKADFLVSNVYILFKDIFNGQSIGKCFVGIRVVDEEGRPAASAKTIIRNLFMVVLLFPLIEYCVMLEDKIYGKRLGDKVAKTQVNDLKPESKDTAYLWISILIIAIVFVLKFSAKSPK